MKPLELGSVGPDVFNVQRALRDGWFLYGFEDGEFGQRTRSAVIAFQAAHGLPVDGVVRDTLYTAMAAGPEWTEEPDADAVEALRGGTIAWNRWRAGHDTVNLRRARLDRLRLPDGDLRGVALDGATLTRSDLQRADLSGASLRAADLLGSDLVHTNLEYCDLRSARLNHAQPFEARLNGARLEDAACFHTNFARSELDGAQFARALLIGAIFTESRAHGADWADAFALRAEWSNASVARSSFKGACLAHSRMESVDFSGCSMQGVELSRCSLIGADLRGADLSGSRVFGVSAWGVELEGATQTGLILTDHDKPRVIADDLEVAQLLHVLLNHKKLAAVFDNVTHRGVLLLGRFRDGGLATLQEVADRLRADDRGFLPMIFDFERPRDRDLLETVVVLAGLSRWVIADLSGPMVPDELAAIVPRIKVPCVSIVEASRHAHPVDAELFASRWLLGTPFVYRDREHLLQSLEAAVIGPAEELRADRIAELRRMHLSS
jgi:uncharacterized protein YjbI with pentapeptide repeats